ncbi:uncharacterized protein LOC111787624 [Cucurbita pepo subsp. pepo]|uniref:uncharacterized protein LOC111787624 n=1 Tax=Cucurbita pepo subsp. pepo TaxID=3664 RepID=UPI000C9D47DC|nr:uncharacterized protein LOC111787624 [Cucurbita pepo subsp. pepo]
MVGNSDSFMFRFLPENLLSAAIEIVPYFTDSFGNSSRIDCGTGHETNFLAWLYCLAKLGVIEEEDYPAVLMRKLQSGYSSHYAALSLWMAHQMMGLYVSKHFRNPLNFLVVMSLGAKRPLLVGRLVGNQVMGTCVVFNPDFDLETFSHELDGRARLICKGILSDEELGPIKERKGSMDSRVE